MKLRDESGQMLVVTALSLTILMGFMALAVDLGLLFRAKRIVQTAADAGASAGALEYNYNGTTNVVSVARAAAGNNGISNVATEVTVNIGKATASPITSPYHNSAGYVQVIVSQPNPTIFMSFFNLASVNVTASAIAGITPPPACIVTLDPTDADTLTVKGNGTISAPNCGIQINSGSSSALCLQGSPTVNATFIHVHGGQDSGGKCGKTVAAPVFQGTGVEQDPYAGLPDPAASCTGANTSTATAVSSSAGLTFASVGPVGGTPTAQITCFSNSVTVTGTLGSAADLDTGNVYVFEKGVTFSGTVTVNGTVDVAGGGYNSGNSNLTINAPGSDNNPADKSLTYNSIGILQPASNTTSSCQDGSAKPLKGEGCLQIQFGSGNGMLNGVVYAPNSLVDLQDEGGNAGAQGVFAATVSVNSDLSITDSFFAQNPNSSPLSAITLVE